MLVIMQQFFQKLFFFERWKKYMTEECKSYLFVYSLLKWNKTVWALPWKLFIYNIKQCLNLESYDLKLTVGYVYSRSSRRRRQPIVHFYLLCMHTRPECAVSLEIGIPKQKGLLHRINFGYQQMLFQADIVDQLEKCL